MTNEQPWEGTLKRAVTMSLLSATFALARVTTAHAEPRLRGVAFAPSNCSTGCPAPLEVDEPQRALSASPASLAGFALATIHTDPHRSKAEKEAWGRPTRGQERTRADAKAKGNRGPFDDQGFLPAGREGAAKSPAEEALNNEGRALAKDKKWEEARKKFEAAYGKVGSPGPLFNLAWAEQNLGMHRAALKHYRIYLLLPPTEKINAAARENAQKYAAECAAKLCTFEVRGATKVTIDGEPPAEVEPGSHKIEMDGAQGPKSKSMSCAAGEKVAVEYEEKVAAPVATVLPVPTATGTTQVADPPPPERTEKGSWLLPGVLAGVGVVGLGVGVGLGAASSGSESDAAALTTGCTATNAAGCTALREADSKTSGLGMGSVVGYLVGGAFFGAALVTTLVQQPWRERRVIGGTVRLVPGFGGAMVLGTF